MTKNAKLDYLLLTGKFESRLLSNSNLLGAGGYGYKTLVFAESDFDVKLVPREIDKIFLIYDEDGNRKVIYHIPSNK